MSTNWIEERRGKLCVSVLRLCDMIDTHGEVFHQVRASQAKKLLSFYFTRCVLLNRINIEDSVFRQQHYIYFLFELSSFCLLMLSNTVNHGLDKFIVCKMNVAFINDPMQNANELIHI